MSFNLILIIIAVICLCICYSIYVSVIQKKNKYEEAFSSIDVQLKKRFDLIPNILSIANKYMEHEKTLMQEITQLRTKAMSLPSDSNNMNEKLELSSQMQTKMRELMVAVENYPTLKADQPMMTAMQTYNEVEEHISAARRFYNSAVRELNNAVEIFPSSIFASMLGITKKEFFEIDESERKPVSASDYLK